RHRRPGHVRHLVAHRVLRRVAQRALAQALPLDRDQTDRQARRVELQHHWGQCPRRQPPQVGHRQVRDHGHRGVGVRAGLEVDLEQADAGQGTRLDVLDAAAEGEEALEAARDVDLDLLWWHARVEGGDDDDGDADGWEHVDGHASQAGGADDRDDQADDDDEVRIPDSKPRHQCSPFSVLTALSFASTSCPGFNWLKLPMTTSSSADNPERISTLSGVSIPVTISRSSSLFCALTSITIAFFSFRLTA